MPQYSFSSIASLAAGQPREKAPASEDDRYEQLTTHPGLHPHNQRYPTFPSYPPSGPGDSQHAPATPPAGQPGHPGGHHQQQPMMLTGHGDSQPDRPSSSSSHKADHPAAPVQHKPFHAASSSTSVHPQLSKASGYPMDDSAARSSDERQVGQIPKSASNAITMGTNSLKMTINTKNLQSTLSSQGLTTSFSKSRQASSELRLVSSSDSKDELRSLKNIIGRSGDKEVKDEEIKEEMDQDMEQDDSKFKDVSTMTNSGEVSRTMLDGLILTETKGGLLVVNVMYKNKEFVGTLMDCTSPTNSWASPRHSEIPPPDKKPKKKKKTKSSDLRLAPRIGLRNRRRIKKRERRDKRLSWDRTNRNNKSSKRISF